MWWLGSFGFTHSDLPMNKLAALYGLSGLISLALEVLWSRYLILQFGVSTWGVIITVAAFMLGLSLGSKLMTKKILVIQNPLRLLAALEGCIALFAWFIPNFLQMTSPTIDLLARSFGPQAWHLLMGGFSLMLLTLPASAMGMSLPLILKAADNSHRHLAYLYGINTLGAVFGALLPLLLLPIFGLTLSMRLIALLGFLLALSYWFSRPPAIYSKPILTTGPIPNKLLMTYGAMGASSLIVEVAWTRLFGLVLLRTEYVLAIILAIFLCGIGLGSALSSRLSRERWLKILPWIASSGILFSIAALPWVSTWIESAQWNSFASALLSQSLFIILLTFPTTLAFGAWFPLLTKGGENQAQQGTRLYSVNCLGGALGALLTGTILIPFLGSIGSLALAAIAILLIGLSWSHSRRAWWFAPLLIVAAIPLMSWPATQRLLPEAMSNSVDLYRYEDAIALTQVLRKSDRSLVLLSDLQRQDASSEATAVIAQTNQARLPLLLHPNAKKVLFLGLGTGISIAGSAPFPNLDRTAVELSKGSIVAAKTWFAPFNQDSIKNTAIIQDDARHYLTASNSNYDVIIGDLFHPDLAGVGALLSAEQFTRAKKHLNADGIFVQWLALNQFDRYSFKVLTRTFYRVFPHNALFIDGMHIALVGYNNPGFDSKSIAQALLNLPSQQLAAFTGGEGQYTWLGRYWGELSDSPGPIQSEWSPIIDYSLPYLRYNNAQELGWLLQYLLTGRPSLEVTETTLQIPAKDREGFERAYIATDLMVRSWVASLNHQTSQANRLIGMAHEANPNDQWIRFAWSDR
jgi:spermidine synthase